VTLTIAVNILERQLGVILLLYNSYEGYLESKDASPLKLQGTYFFKNGSAAV
jgi:hypothetical protein